MKICSALKIFFLIALFAIFLLLAKISLAGSGLVINEIMYNAPSVDEKHEWLELQNTGQSDIDLTDYKFNDGSNHVLNPPPQNGSRGSMIMPAGSYLILASNASTTILDLPNYTGSVIDTVMSLNNTSSTLKILDKNGAEITSASYVKEMGASGNGKTLEWNGKIFKESSAEGGTPGEENSKPTLKSPPTNQTATTKIAQISPPKINPINEADQKASQPKNQSTLIPDQNLEPPAQSQSSSSAQAPPKQTSSGKAAISAPLQNQTVTKNSNPNILLSLAAILFISITASIGLIYFKRKKSPPVDGKPKLP